MFALCNMAILAPGAANEKITKVWLRWDSYD